MSQGHQPNHDHHSGGKRMSAQATLHCLTGCAIGEVLGLLIGTALGLSSLLIIALAVTLAFISGYALTMKSLLGHGMTLAAALKIALAADTLSITVMEITDNAIMLVIPGAMGNSLTNPTFWAALVFALAVAFLVAWPVNHWLIKRGQGHALHHHH